MNDLAFRKLNEVPWLEPDGGHIDGNRMPWDTQDDWFTFRLGDGNRFYRNEQPEMFIKESYRFERPGILIVGETDNVRNFRTELEIEHRSSVYFDNLDEALNYCQMLYEGKISAEQLHTVGYVRNSDPLSNLIGWRDFYVAANGNVEYTNRLMFDCIGGSRDGIGPRECVKEDLSRNRVFELNGEYVYADGYEGDAGKQVFLNKVRSDLERLSVFGDSLIEPYCGYPAGTDYQVIWYEAQVASGIVDVASQDGQGEKDLRNEHAVEGDARNDSATELCTDKRTYEAESNIPTDNRSSAFTRVGSYPNDAWANLYVSPESVELKDNGRGSGRAIVSLPEWSQFGSGMRFSVGLGRNVFADAKKAKEAFAAGKDASVHIGLQLNRYQEGLPLFYRDDATGKTLEKHVDPYEVESEFKAEADIKRQEKRQAALEQQMKNDKEPWINFFLSKRQAKPVSEIDRKTGEVHYYFEAHALRGTVIDGVDLGNINGKSAVFRIPIKQKSKFDQLCAEKNNNRPDAKKYLQIGTKACYTPEVVVVMPDGAVKHVDTKVMATAHDTARENWYQRGWNRQHGCKEQSQFRASVAQDLNKARSDKPVPMRGQDFAKNNGEEAI